MPKAPRGPRSPRRPAAAPQEGDVIQSSIRTGQAPSPETDEPPAAALRPADNPGGVVGRHLAGVITCEEDPVRLLRKRRTPDRPHRD